MSSRKHLALHRGSGLSVAAVVLGLGLAGLTPDRAAACNPYGYVGSICWTAQPWCPRGYMTTTGSSMPISQNPALFSLIGSSFGGNSTTVFALPDLRGREPIGSGKPPGSREFHVGQRVMSEPLYPTTQHLPSHSHEVDLSNVSIYADLGAATSSPAFETSPEGAVWAIPGRGGTLFSTTSNTTMAEGVISGSVAYGGVITGETPGREGQHTASSGGPKLGLTACIATDGLYPSRAKPQ